MQTCFVDTGVLLRLFDKGSSEQADLSALVFRLLRGAVRPATSFQNLREFANVSTRPLSARGGFGQTLAVTLGRMRWVRQQFRMLDENDAVHQAWTALVQQQQVTGKAVHDANLAAIMQVNGIADLVTLNAKDFRRYPSLTVHDPSTLLASVAAAP